MPTPSDQALFAVLSVHPGLLALVADRIYPVEAPEGAVLPMLVYQQIVSDPATTHGEGAEARLDELTYQLTALAALPLVAAGIIYQARLALESAPNLGAVLINEQSLVRDEDANCHARAADFIIFNDPDAG